MKMYILGLLAVFLVFSSQAQRTYSKKNLQQISTAELYNYSLKAKKTRKVGVILATAGSVTAVLGGYLMVSNFDFGRSSPQQDRDMRLGAAMFLIGTTSTLAGIPILSVGAVRGHRINKIIKSKVKDGSFELSLGLISNPRTQLGVPALGLKFKF